MHGLKLGLGSRVSCHSWQSMETEQRNHFQVFVLLCDCYFGDVWYFCLWFLLHHQKDTLPNGFPSYRRIHKFLLQNFLLYRTLHLHLLQNKDKPKIFPHSLFCNPIFNDSHHNFERISKCNDDIEPKFQSPAHSLHIIFDSRAINSKWRRKRSHWRLLSNYKQTKDDVLCRIWYKLGKNAASNLDIFHKLVRLQSFQRSLEKFSWKRLPTSLWKNARSQWKARNTGIWTGWWVSRETGWESGRSAK